MCMAHEHGVCVLCSYAYAHDDVEVAGRVGLDDQRCLEPREAALADADVHLQMNTTHG